MLLISICSIRDISLLTFMPQIQMCLFGTAINASDIIKRYIVQASLFDYTKTLSPLFRLRWFKQITQLNVHVTVTLTITLSVNLKCNIELTQDLLRSSTVIYFLFSLYVFSTGYFPSIVVMDLPAKHGVKQPIIGKVSLSAHHIKHRYDKSLKSILTQDCTLCHYC